MPLPGGAFDYQCGSVSVDTFSLFGIAIKKIFHKEKSYQAQVFLTCKGEREKRMHFVVVRSLNVCLTVL